MNEHELYDITIIGGGPVGLFAAFYAGMRKAKTKIIESLPELGGQLTMLYPEKTIYDIAGIPAIKAIDLVGNLTEQIERFHQTICLNEEVLQVTTLEDGTLQLETNRGLHYTKTVIITAGSGAFQPRRLEVPGASETEDDTLHYYVKNPALFKNKQVTVCGGGDSAIDIALMLEPIAAEVTLIHRRPNFRAHEHTLDLLAQSTVQIKTPYIVEEVLHQDGKIHQIALKQPKGTELEYLKTDALLVNYGFNSSIGPLKNWSLELNRNSIVVKSDMSTNVPGIYAAGDICTYDGKVNLIATGFGEAPTAVNNAMHFIQPSNRTQPMHSTSLFEQEAKKDRES